MEMQEMIERLLAGQAKAEADRAKDREQMLAEIRAGQEKADANREDLKSGQAKMIAAIKGKTDALIANIKIDRKETTACQYAMETSPEKMEPNLDEKDTAMEQQEIPTSDTSVTCFICTWQQ
jgi:hypothetical protein